MLSTKSARVDHGVRPKRRPTPAHTPAITAPSRTRTRPWSANFFWMSFIMVLPFVGRIATCSDPTHSRVVALARPVIREHPGGDPDRLVNALRVRGGSGGASKPAMARSRHCFGGRLFL